MKLTPSQIETIETYLLSWGLEYQDFYEEILDHFVSDIEQRIKEEDFETAFTQTKATFSNKKFKGAFGLKAFEAEYIYGIQQELKKKLRLKMKEQFTSWRIVLWFAFGLYLQYFFDKDQEVALAPFMIFIAIGITVVVPMLVTEHGFSLKSRWTLVDKSIQEQKAKSMFAKTRRRALGLNMIIMFYVPIYLCSIFFQFSGGLGVKTDSYLFTTFLLFFVVVSTSFAWALVELVFSELKREKHEA